MTPLAVVVLVGLTGVAVLVAWNLRVLQRAPAPLADPPAVSILIPARDEVATLEGAVRAACAQAGSRVEVVVLDDGSTDGTAALLARLRAGLPRLATAVGAPLPSGWAGKAWACWQLARRHARHEWLLFVDADVRLAPDAVARALASAREQQVVFLSAFPRQRLGSVGEGLVVPLIYLVLLAYLPIALIRRHPLPALSAGCGQFMLVRRDAYLAAGGHSAIRATFHDGLMLARRLKAAGFPVGLVDGTDLATCRMYAGLPAAWRGFARNAYEALGSPASLAALITLSGGLFVLPFVVLPAAFVAGPPHVAALWGAAVSVALAIRTALAVRFAIPLWTVVATPLAVALMIGIQLHSYLRHATGRPVVWRARAYPAAARYGRN